MHVEVEYVHNMWLRGLPHSGQEVTGAGLDGDGQDIPQRPAPL